MIDDTIKNHIDQIYDKIESVNKLIAELHEKNVEIRILYKEGDKNNPARLDFWRAVEHVDYLEQHTKNKME